MPVDAGCEIFVVRSDPASFISNAVVNTVFSRWMTVSIRMNAQGLVFRIVEI
jgi:hypothetical protein